MEWINKPDINKIVVKYICTVRINTGSCNRDYVCFGYHK